MQAVFFESAAQRAARREEHPFDSAVALCGVTLEDGTCRRPAPKASTAAAPVPNI
jgi:hypothetical protein